MCFKFQVETKHGQFPECELPSWPSQGPNSSEFLRVLSISINKVYFDILYVDYNVLFLYGLGKGEQHDGQGWQYCSICQGIMSRGSTKFFIKLTITYHKA